MEIYTRYKAQHKYWNDIINVNWNDKTFFRENLRTERGTFEYNDNKLVLKWKRWPEETLVLENNQFKNELFKMIPIIQNSIPKLIHQIWLGPKKRPNILMKSFIKIHNANILDDIDSLPSESKEWFYICWDEDMIKNINLKNISKYNKCNSYSGKSDIARYEILYRYGGMYFDSDCICLKQISEEMLKDDFFSVYENEKRRPGLIANGIIGTSKENDIMMGCVNSISTKKKLEPACKYLGPHLMTDMVNRSKCSYKIYPSYIFLPIWLNPKKEYTNYPNALNNDKLKDNIICNHLWTSTNNNFTTDIYYDFFKKNYNGISVLIPFYNEEIDVFRECLDSILKQTIPWYLEVVIVNDGSDEIYTKNLQELVKNYNFIDSYIQFKIYQLEENKGLSFALNYGIYKCEYNLIARMDSDDIMIDTRLKKQYDYFKNNPDTAILGTGIQMFDHDTGKLREKKLHPEKIDIKYVKSKKSLWFLNHPTVMFKKDIILQCENYKEHKSDIPEDFDLWIRVLKKGFKIANLNQILLKYRRTKKNLSGNLSKSTVNKMLNMVQNL